MPIKSRHLNRIASRLLVILVGIIGTPLTFAQSANDVDVTISVADYYDIILDNGDTIVMNDVTWNMVQDGTRNGTEYEVSGLKFFGVECNTPIRLRTLREIILSHEGAGPSFPIEARVNFQGTSGGTWGSDLTYSWVDLDPGSYNGPDWVALSVDVERAWTVNTNAGVYAGTAILEIGPQ